MLMYALKSFEKEIYYSKNSIRALKNTLKHFIIFLNKYFNSCKLHDLKYIINKQKKIAKIIMFIINIRYILTKIYRLILKIMVNQLINSIKLTISIINSL
jgi:hypothetical protein